MTKKNVPDRLHLVFRDVEPCDEQLGVDQFYDTPGGGTSKTSLDDVDDFVDLGCQSVWEVSNHFVALLETRIADMTLFVIECDGIVAFNHKLPERSKKQVYFAKINWSCKALVLASKVRSCVPSN